MNASVLAAALRRIDAAQFQFERDFPGESDARQPVHVVYGGAHLFTAQTPSKLGALALEAFDRYAPEPATLATLLGLAAPVAQRVHARARAKLQREPIEDFRIDFEDGFGPRTHDEEDAHADRVAGALAQGEPLPPFLGVRLKPLTAELAPRAFRTLERVLVGVAAAPKRPAQFAITVPKVTSPQQLQALADVLDALEAQLNLPRLWLSIEVMVEAPQALFSASGSMVLPLLIPAARGRLRGAHLGAYDYTASSGITAQHQGLGHPACDFARQAMRVAFSGTRIALSDGATTTLPLPPHKGPHRTPAQEAENQQAVHGAWALSIADIRNSLRSGFYQGWDLHPAQVAIRHPVLIAFFLEALPAATARLKHFVDGLGRATQLGGSFDDAATGQGLLNFFLRGLACGALTSDELEATGLTSAELASRSFSEIARARRS